MNGRTAKLLRRVVGKKHDLSAPREYQIVNDKGTVRNVPGSPRDAYQKSKKQIMGGLS